MAIEIEKKYRLTEELRNEILKSLEEIGAEFAGEDDEENTLFANDELFERHAIVRIRQTQDGAKLTYKQRIKSASDAKQQIEFESGISNADDVRSIIEALGLKAAIVYEKRRRTYKLRQVEVVLDTLPFGLFMEIEGPVTGIAEAEMLLEIEDLEVVPETYPQLTTRFGTRSGDLITARFEKSGK